MPGKPTITNTGDEVDSTFILTWLKPNYDGLDSIIKYKVEWRKKPITDASVFFDEKNIDATQLTVNNLEGGAEYEFKVFAENRAGFSEPDTMTFRVRKGSGKFFATFDVVHFHASNTCKLILSATFSAFTANFALQYMYVYVSSNHCHQITRSYRDNVHIMYLAVCHVQLSFCTGAKEVMGSEGKEL